MPIPRFKFTLSSISDTNNGYITLKGERIHRIEDANKFYEALGYTSEINKSGILPDEFIWDKYRKVGSKCIEDCLQIKIIYYLIEHSETFKLQYADQIKMWLENCSERWKSNSTVCASCSQVNLVNYNE